MKQSFARAIPAVAMLALALHSQAQGEPAGTGTPIVNPIFADQFESLPVVTLNLDLTTNTTLTAGNAYVVPANEQLIVKAGATLTIEPGTRISGESGASIVIARGARIEAVGTAEQPIVFTSVQPPGQKTSGSWGGLIVLGAAPINVNVLAPIPSNQASFGGVGSSLPDSMFGGDIVADDSGTLRYVRIEFGGAEFAGGNRHDNLALAGVGSGTEIDFVQTHRGANDGVEIFGGTVNMKHMVSTQNRDEGFNFDNGWRGNAQFLVVQHVAPDGAISSANGLESQNHATAASYTADPRTVPTIFNATFIGDPSYIGGQSFAAVFRRGTGGKYTNVVMMDFPQGIEVRDLPTKDQLDAGNLFIKTSILFNNDAGGDGDNWPPPQAIGDIDEPFYFAAMANANKFVAPGLPAARASLDSPVFAPTPGSEAFFGASAPTANGFFDATANFIGAVGADDWTRYWTAYPQPAP